MKNDLIERLNEITAKKNCAATTKAAIAEAIEVIQAKTAPAVPTGTWTLEMDSTKSVLTCSNCKTEFANPWFSFANYCPVCGANMMG